MYVTLVQRRALFLITVLHHSTASECNHRDSAANQRQHTSQHTGVQIVHSWCIMPSVCMCKFPEWMMPLYTWCVLLGALPEHLSSFMICCGTCHLLRKQDGRTLTGSGCFLSSYTLRMVTMFLQMYASLYVHQNDCCIALLRLCDNAPAGILGDSVTSMPTWSTALSTGLMPLTGAAATAATCCR
jgi:hypothetical protein